MTADIPQMGYQPKTPYALALEAFTMGELRRRTSPQKVRASHRYEFYTIVCVTRGTCTQVVDFRSVACEPGSILLLRPGQVHTFGPSEDWDGWIVLFLPEFVLPAAAASGEAKLIIDIQRLSEHVVLTPGELQTIDGAIAQMRADTQLDGPVDVLQSLLRHQLHTLFTRLHLLQANRLPRECVMSPHQQRFLRFQQLVEARFTQWHQVQNYADQLGYTERSLARAVIASTNMTSKAFIAARITLEAKRLLAYTDQPVATIGDRLGFAEPTNFGKFFKREASCTPAEFRQRHKSPS